MRLKQIITKWLLKPRYALLFAACFMFWFLTTSIWVTFGRKNTPEDYSNERPLGFPEKGSNNFDWLYNVMPTEQDNFETVIIDGSSEIDSVKTKVEIQNLNEYNRITTGNMSKKVLLHVPLVVGKTQHLSPSLRVTVKPTNEMVLMEFKGTTSPIRNTAETPQPNNSSGHSRLFVVSPISASNKSDRNLQVHFGVKTTDFNLTLGKNTSSKIYPTPFKYLILEKEICIRHFPMLFVIIYIHSASDHFDQREIIRDTWGNKNLYHRLRTATVFMLGQTSSKNIQSKINSESQRHHDIIQEDFLDSYKNLTYKGVAALRWITTFCQNAAYVLKVDDDMLVNTFGLVRFLKKITKQKPSFQQILCLSFNGNMPILRNKKSKWYVSESDYPGKKYLPYCSGSAFILPTSIVPKLYNASFSTPFFWVDDVYITGLVAKTANVTQYPIHALYALYRNQTELDRNVVFGDKIFGLLNRKGVSSEWYYEVWRNITDIEQWMG